MANDKHFSWLTCIGISLLLETVTFITLLIRSAMHMHTQHLANYTMRLGSYTLANISKVQTTDHTAVSMHFRGGLATFTATWIGVGLLWAYVLRIRAKA